MNHSSLDFPAPSGDAGCAHHGGACSGRGILSFKTMEVMPDENSVFYFVGIDNARFKKPVTWRGSTAPARENPSPDAGYGNTRWRRVVDGEIVAEAELMCAKRDRTDTKVTNPSLSREMIHPSAIIHPEARLGANVAVGPYRSSVSTSRLVITPESGRTSSSRGIPDWVRQQHLSVLLNR